MMFVFPFISRSHHEDVVSCMNAAIADRDKRIAALEQELHRLHDGVYQNNFGFQLHDTLPKADETVEPELTEEQQYEQQREQENTYRNLRLASLARTNPSRLGPAIAQEMQLDEKRRAEAAHPARVAFDSVRAEVMRA